MTELFIDGVAVVLPKEFNSQVKHENPFFTKNGEYTYDIELDLNNPTNAKLYEHLYRVNSVTEIKTKRRAVLIADHRIYCNGTEVVTGWTDNKVSVQIASGNSELNYFIGSDLAIESLNMGSAVMPQLSNDMTSFLNKKYPEVEFNIPSVLVGETMVNPFDMVHTTVSSGSDRRDTTTTAYRTVPDGIYIPMPYMGVIIEKIIQALGYAIVENQFTSTPWRYQVIVHGQKTTEYAKMFPNWTIKEFLEEVEKLYSIVFLVESKKKEVRIMLSANFYSQPAIAYLSSVLDEYTEDTEDSEDENNLGIRNIKYDLPDNEFYKKRRLPTALMQMATKKTIAGVSEITEFFMNESKGMELVTLDGTEEQYIRTSFEYKDHSGTLLTLHRRCSVNEYADLLRNANDDNYVTIKMIPIQQGVAQIKNVSIKNGTEAAPYYAKRIVPVLENDTTLTGLSDDEAGLEATQQGIEEYIKNNNYDKDTGKSTIYLGFYTGIKNQVLYLRRQSTNPYPTVYADNILNKGLIFYPSESRNPMGDAKMSEEGESMRLKVLAEKLYQNAYDIQRDKKYVFHSHDPNLYDVRSVFVIKNKRFVCKECVYTVDAQGRQGAWEGTFYPIKISDTEALSRWILTDGKWRDGGVWLDNGRWMDD